MRDVLHKVQLSNAHEGVKKINSLTQRGLLAATKAGISTPRHQVTKEKHSQKELGRGATDRLALLLQV
jgi:hypothetical protein